MGFSIAELLLYAAVPWCCFDLESRKVCIYLAPGIVGYLKASWLTRYFCSFDLFCSKCEIW